MCATNRDNIRATFRSAARSVPTTQLPCGAVALGRDVKNGFRRERCRAEAPAAVTGR